MRTFEHAAPEYSSLQKEDFKLHERDDAIHDAKFETKSVGFFKDAMLRFGKNAASHYCLHNHLHHCFFLNPRANDE